MHPSTRFLAVWVSVVSLLWSSGPVLAQSTETVDASPGSEEGEEVGHGIILSVSILPRVDGWDPIHGHRSGWGVAGGLDLSPWDASTEVLIEVTYLTNGEESLLSFDFGLKVPFHRGHRWDVHGVIGPALAYEHFRVVQEDGTTSKEGAFVVGTIAGVGSTYWFHRHIGVSLDLNYRILGGEGIAHRLFTALALNSRW